MLHESEKAFEDWNDHCDNIDKHYANLERLSQHDARQRVPDVLGQLEIIKPSIYAKPPRAGCRPEVQGPPAALPDRQRSCWSGAAIVAFDLTRIDDLIKLVRDDSRMTGRGVAWCRYESGDERQLLQSRIRLRRPQGPPRLPALVCAQLARGDVGRGRELPDARRGAQAVSEVLRRRVPERRVQGRQGQQGDRRRRQPRARQVLGDLAQGMNARRLGRRGLRGHPRRGRPAPASCATSSRAPSRPTAPCSRLAGPGARRAAVQGPARRGEHC